MSITTGYLDQVKELSTTLIHEALHQLAPNACAACGNGEFGVLSDPDNDDGVAIFKMTPWDHDVFLPTIAATCISCGLILQFRLDRVMEIVDQQQKSGEDNKNG